MIGRSRLADAARWTGCFALALSLHAVGAAALLAHWIDETTEVAAAPALVIELAPLAAAPPTPASHAPPGPPQAQAAAQPQTEPEKPVAALAVAPVPLEDPEVTATVAPVPPEKPRRPLRRRAASLSRAPSDAERAATRAAAPAPGAANRADALPNWKSALVARLERYKRYPPEAQARGEHGVAQLAFDVDRGGHVHDARIARSSGSAALDRATLELIGRAQPLPPPPPEVHGARIAIVVPIRYSAR
jgi:protein TonB